MTIDTTKPSKPTPTERRVLASVIHLMRAAAESLEATAHSNIGGPALPQYSERASALRVTAGTLEQIHDGTLPYRLGR